MGTVISTEREGWPHEYKSDGLDGHRPGMHVQYVKRIANDCLHFLYKTGGEMAKSHFLTLSITLQAHRQASMFTIIIDYF